MNKTYTRAQSDYNFSDDGFKAQNKNHFNLPREKSSRSSRLRCKGLITEIVTMEKLTSTIDERNRDDFGHLGVRGEIFTSRRKVINAAQARYLSPNRKLSGLMSAWTTWTPCSCSTMCRIQMVKYMTRG